MLTASKDSTVKTVSFLIGSRYSSSEDRGVRKGIMQSVCPEMSRQSFESDKVCTQKTLQSSRCTQVLFLKLTNFSERESKRERDSQHPSIQTLSSPTLLRAPERSCFQGLEQCVTHISLPFFLSVSSSSWLH